MAVNETISSTGDYSSAAAWEAGIPSNPTETYTGTVDESPFNAGQVEINVSNTNNHTIRLTGGPTHRYDQQTDWPNIDAVRDQCAYISSSAGNGSVVINTNNVQIDGLAIIRTGTNDCIRVEGASRDDLVFFDLLLIGANNATTRRAFDRVNNGTPGNEITIYNCVATSCRELWSLSAQNVYIANSTAVMMDIVSSQRYGFYGVYAIGTPTVTAKNCIMMGAQTADYVKDGGATLTMTNCVSEDATGSSGLQNENRVQLMMNPWLGELDVSVPNDTKGQQWADDVFWGYSFEGNRIHEAFGGNKTGYSVGTTNAFHGTYCLISALSSNFRDLYTPRYLAGFGTEYWYGLVFTLDSGATIGTGNSFRFFDAQVSGTSHIWHQMQESGGNIQVRIQDRMNSNLGTWQTITKGTTYKLMVRINHAVSGNVEWWLKATGSAGWGSAIDSWSGDYSADSPVNELRFLGNAGTGSSGDLCIDYLFASSSANVDVEGTSYGLGSSREGDTTYHGSDESGTFTTDYEGDTRSDWQIGPDELVGAAPSIVPTQNYHRFIGGMR